jgi:succinyl-diaminopimelate desuccinylase
MSGSERAEVTRRLAERTLELCAIPSETGHEKEIADFVEAFCVAQAGRDATRRLDNNVICAPGGSGPRLALIGHLDTVRCADDQPLRIADGRVYGCGATDMKAGVAVMMELLERRSDLGGAEVIWVFYEGEEGLSENNGLEPVLRSGALEGVELAIVLEPTDQTLMLGCMGVLHARATVGGKRAHSARPWQGENAIYNAIPLLERLSRLERREVTVGGLPFYEVIGATQAQTHNSKNVVPDALELNVNFRFAPGKTVREAEAELRAVLEGAEVRIHDAAPAGAVHLDHPLLERWRAATELPLAPKQAWTDVARLTEHGVPAVNFGPGETAQAHQAGEWCSLESLDWALAGLLSLFATLRS